MPNTVSVPLSSENDILGEIVLSECSPSFSVAFVYSSAHLQMEFLAERKEKKPTVKAEINLKDMTLSLGAHRTACSAQGCCIECR